MILAYPLVIACGLLALYYGYTTSKQVLAADAGSSRMQEIAAAVQEGARAYLNRQYTTIGIVGIVILVLLSLALGLHVGIGFLIGALLSGAAGYVGMNVSVRANVRTAQASRSRARGGSRHRVQVGRHHRAAGGRPRPAGRGGLLLLPARARARPATA